MYLLKLFFSILGLLLLIKAVFALRKLFSTITTPYSKRESIGWVVRNIAGISKKNAGIVKSISSPRVLNKSVAPELKIAIIGDIMSMHGRPVIVSPEVKEYISDCDYLLGNFEATITSTAKKRWDLAMDERHTPRIMDMLDWIFPPEKTYLACSNNHAGDFGEKEYFKSVEMLESRGFNVFGWTDRPHCNVNESVRIIPGTAWSNRSCGYVATLEDAKNSIKPEAFNLLYPHFGFELELYPRPETVGRAKGLIRKFDALVGHHPHCPQPVTIVPGEGGNKLIAYSLGDFCCGLKLNTYQYGIVIKATLGKNENGKWLLGRAKWRFTRCAPRSGGSFAVGLVDRLPF